jgi:hypothetical protein
MKIRVLAAAGPGTRWPGRHQVVGEVLRLARTARPARLPAPRRVSR